MARRPLFRPGLQEGLLDLLRPASARLAAQPGERARPGLAEVAREWAGRPAAEVRPVLEEVVRSVGATPDLAALTEFAERIEAGEDPFA
ncbi:hypothetical protein SAMN06893096_11449 [Geodermatophilus pulveris]|uniref:Uncharacterized protein n=1 Tax=Geodermatophilus pulveris TaxID=1564159 RepID=A0A239JFN1_9ACTN|nr:hypothetical protein [Geodermatophilus pulveris]SNT04412.1 hypothetical protein SAMN06893096_11449 [Geodermatophilus pulveris]